MRLLHIAITVVLLLDGNILLSQNVVISEIYGGGGNAGTVYKNDFIELYNPTSSSVDLTGWSVQYISAAGTGTWQKTNLTGSVAPRSYYLVQEAAGTGGTTGLPTPDAIGTIAMAAAAGKVALVSNTTALTGASPVSTSIIDLVGFGTANFFEGTGAAPAPSNTNSIERKAKASSTSASMQPLGADQFSGNGYDSNDNSADFVIRSPEPQNALSIAEPDVIPPTFTSTFPQSTNISTSGFDVIANLNEASKVYFVVLADGSTAPSAVQVKAGQDDHGSLAAINGSFAISSGGNDFSLTVAGLSSGTNYDVYVVAEDIALNLQANVVLLNVATLVAPTITPSTATYIFTGFTEQSKQSASFSYMLSAANLLTDVHLTVSGDFLISSDNSTFGSALNILASSLASPQTVYVKFNPSGNLGTRTGTITHSSTGAVSRTVSLTAISIDPFNQNFNDPLFLTNSGWTQYSVTGTQVWSSTNFGHTCLTGCNSSTVDKAAQINGFSGSPRINEDWLISPQLDLTTFTNYPAISFATISAFAGDALQLKYSTDYSGAGDPSTATWISLDGKFPPPNSSAWTTSSNVILPKSIVYVAFVYTSNTTAASRWTLDDWKVENVPSYLNVSSTNFSFGEVVAGESSSQSFAITANGYGDITVSVPTAFEISFDDVTFSQNLLVTQAEASTGKMIYVRFAPPTKELKWTGAINFTGTSLNMITGSLIGSSYPKSETFNIATYNLEFFGTDLRDASNNEFGPTDDALQVTNVTTVLQTIAADVFAVEEISDDNAFDQLVSNLQGYDKVVCDRWSYSWQPPDPNYPPQKLGFIYNTSRVQLLSSRVMFAKMYDSIIAGTKTLPAYPTGTSSSFWSSGRLPFMATFDVTINGTKRRIRVIDIHGKSASDQESYNRRVYDSKALHDSLNAYYPHDNIILLGDFNDQVYGSITTGAASSYKVFVDDVDHCKAITYDLTVNGESTFPRSTSFIDNIVISDELMNALVANSTTTEDPRSYINNYLNTTSDHLPVWSRFFLSSKADQTLGFNSLPTKTFGDANFVLTATTSSGLVPTFTSSDPSIVLINGNVASILRAGTATITASQPGNGDFNAAISVDQSLTINKGNQTITFNPLPSKKFGEADFSLSATTSSILPITFQSSDPSIASITGATVSVHKAGVVTITASSAGDANYNVAADVSQLLTISKADQTITFNSLEPVTQDAPPFLLAASSDSNLPITYSSDNASVATILGNMVTIIGGGSTNIIASQEGNENYNAAVSVSRQLTVTTVTAIEPLLFAKVNVYPNPTAGVVNIELPNAETENVEARLVNTIGELIFKTEMQLVDGKMTIDLSSVQPGMYLLNIAASATQTSQRIIRK